MFIADPRRYEPQFGGYCAYAVSLNTTAHGDPYQWAIVNDKLYVNANVVAAHLWSLDRSKHRQGQQELAQHPERN